MDLTPPKQRLLPPRLRLPRWPFHPHVPAIASISSYQSILTSPRPSHLLSDLHCHLHLRKRHMLDAPEAQG